MSDRAEQELQEDADRLQKVMEEVVGLASQRLGENLMAIVVVLASAAGAMAAMEPAMIAVALKALLDAHGDASDIGSPEHVVSAVQEIARLRQELVETRALLAAAKLEPANGQA